MSDDNDTCRPVEVDGEIIRVHGSRPMDEYEQGLFAQIVRAAKRRMEAEDQPAPVTRPQDCDCGASEVAMVAHGVNCKSRRTPLATPTPIATHGPHPTGHLEVRRMPLPPMPPAEDE